MEKQGRQEVRLGEERKEGQDERMQDRRKRGLGRFVRSMLKVGCIGFGGGSALIPVISHEIIEVQGIENEENYDQDVVVASITPGALPVEISASVGRRNFGTPGMLLGAAAMALPGVVLTVLCVTVLSYLQSGVIRVVQTAAVGILAFILYLLADYIRGMLMGCRKDGYARLCKVLVVMAGVFVLSCGKNLYALFGIDVVPFFSISTVRILLAAFFVIFALGGGRQRWRMAAVGVLTVLFLAGSGKRQILSDEVLRVVEALMLLLAVSGFLKEVRSFHGAVASGRAQPDGRLETYKEQPDRVSALQKKLSNEASASQQEKADGASVPQNMQFGGAGMQLCVRDILRDVSIWLSVLLLLALPAMLLQLLPTLLFVGRGLLSSLMSFGGGDAYLTVADGIFVEGGMITQEQYYGHIVSIVNVLPGSILCKTLAAVGYYVGWNGTGTLLGGLLTALAGFGCSIAASCGFYFVIYHFYDSLSENGSFRRLSRWIRPMVAGLLLNIMLSMANQCVRAAGILEKPVWAVLLLMAVLAVADFLLACRKKVSPALLLAGNLAVVFLLL